jgi:hypothetical protein
LDSLAAAREARRGALIKKHSSKQVFIAEKQQQKTQSFVAAND